MSTLNKEVILILIRDILDEKFKQQETTLISFIGDNNKLLFEKLDVINKKNCWTRGKITVCKKNC